MSNTIDQQFVEFVVKTIVSNPDKVSIERTIDEKGVLLELTVDPEDLGRVIGKRGAAAQALRTLLRALGTKNDARYNLKIVDVGGDRSPKSQEPTAKSHESEDKKESESQQQEDKKASDTIGSSVEVAESSSQPVVKEEEKEDSPVQEEKVDEDQSDTKSSFEKTRRELQDLDDLDI